jgi:hypothetical protein
MKPKPLYTIFQERFTAAGTWTVSTATGIRRVGGFKTEADAQRKADEMNRAAYADHFYQRATRALQFLDEMGGPDAGDYVKVMRRLAEECERRAEVCFATHLSAGPAYTGEGFVLVNTGGGCMAYQRNTEHAGCYVLITIQGDADAPTSTEDAVELGLYDANGDAQLGHMAAENFADAMRKIRAGSWVKS